MECHHCEVDMGLLLKKNRFVVFVFFIICVFLCMDTVSSATEQTDTLQTGQFHNNLIN